MTNCFNRLIGTDHAQQVNKEQRTANERVSSSVTRDAAYVDVGDSRDIEYKGDDRADDDQRVHHVPDVAKVRPRVSNDAKVDDLNIGQIFSLFFHLLLATRVSFGLSFGHSFPCRMASSLIGARQPSGLNY